VRAFLKIGVLVTIPIFILSASLAMGAEDWWKEKRQQALAYMQAADTSLKQGKRELVQAQKDYESFKRTLFQKAPGLKDKFAPHDKKIRNILQTSQEQIDHYSQKTTDLLTRVQTYEKWIARAERLVPTKKNREDAFYAIDALLTISETVDEFTRVNTDQQFRDEFAANPALLAFKKVVNSVNRYFYEAMKDAQTGLKKAQKLIRERGGKTIGGGRAEGLGRYAGDKEKAWMEENGELLYRLGLVTGDGGSVWVTKDDGTAWIWDDRQGGKDWVRLGGRKKVVTLFAYYQYAFDRQIDLAQLINWCTHLQGRFKRLEAAAIARYDALQLKVPAYSDTSCRKWLVQKYGYEKERLQLLAESQNSRDRFTGKYIFSKPKRLRIQANEIYDLLTHTYQLKGRVREKGGDTGIAGVEVEIASAGATQTGRTDTHGKFAVEIRRPVVKSRRFSIEISHPDYRSGRVEHAVSRQCVDLGNLHLAGKDKPERSVQGLTISPSTKELKVGESVSFTVSARLADGSVETLPDSVVTYTNAPEGRFKAVRAGSYTVTATYRSHSAAAAVTVADKKPASAEAQQDAPEDAERGSKGGPAQRTAAGGLTIAGPTRAVTGEGVSFTACNGAGDPYTSGSFSWNISREDIMSLQRSGNPVSGSVFKAGKATVMVKHEGRLAFLDLVIEAKVPDITGLSAGEAQNRITGVGLVPALRPKDPAPDQKRAYTVYSQTPAPGALRGEGETVAGEIYGKYESDADADENGADEAGPSPTVADGFQDAGLQVSSAADVSGCAAHSDCPARHNCQEGRCVPLATAADPPETTSAGGGFQDAGINVVINAGAAQEQKRSDQAAGPDAGFADAGLSSGGSDNDVAPENTGNAELSVTSWSDKSNGFDDLSSFHRLSFLQNSLDAECDDYSHPGLEISLVRRESRIKPGIKRFQLLVNNRYRIFFYARVKSASNWVHARQQNVPLFLFQGDRVRLELTSLDIPANPVVWEGALMTKSRAKIRSLHRFTRKQMKYHNVQELITNGLYKQAAQLAAREATELIRRYRRSEVDRISINRVALCFHILALDAAMDGDLKEFRKYKEKELKAYDFYLKGPEVPSVRDRTGKTRWEKHLYAAEQVLTFFGDIATARAYYQQAMQLYRSGGGAARYPDIKTKLRFTMRVFNLFYQTQDE